MSEKIDVDKKVLIEILKALEGIKKTLLSLLK
jgi:hypothetical protein